MAFMIFSLEHILINHSDQLITINIHLSIIVVQTYLYIVITLELVANVFSIIRHR